MTSINNTPERLLSLAEASEIIGIHRRTLKKHARAGSIPYARIGDLYKFRASDLHRWFNEQATVSRTRLGPAPDHLEGESTCN
jgi:excisionase family DNA binding protein